MARYEAHLQCPALTSADRQPLVGELASALGVSASWLDHHNASLALVLPPQGLGVQVLLEFQNRGQVTVLVNSREGMGQGAPQTRACFERLLSLLKQLLPVAQLRYRSDLDGPIRGQLQLSPTV
jgi:hypothetical protein